MTHDLVPKKKEVSRGDNDYEESEKFGYNRCIKDMKPLLKYVEKLEAESVDDSAEKLKLGFLLQDKDKEILKLQAKVDGLEKRAKQLLSAISNKKSFCDELIIKQGDMIEAKNKEMLDVQAKVERLDRAMREITTQLTDLLQSVMFSKDIADTLRRLNNIARKSLEGEEK